MAMDLHAKIVTYLRLQETLRRHQQDRINLEKSISKTEEDIGKLKNELHAQRSDSDLLFVVGDSDVTNTLVTIGVNTITNTSVPVIKPGRAGVPV